jgi:FkbM family methyltransferase
MKFIQIGAHIGNDEAYNIIKNYDVEFGLLIEPLPHLIPKLKEFYKDIPNIIIENKAISIQQEKNIVFYYDTKDSNTELGSINKQHLIDHKVNKDDIKEIIVPTETLGSILDRYNIQELDYLFIDTEGLDCLIINTLDFQKYKIHNIIFEDLHSDGSWTKGINYNTTIKKMKSEGYKTEKINNNNTQCFLQDNIHIIYRTSDNGYKKEKPNYINNENCLKNAISCFPPYKFKWTIIADNVSPKTKSIIEKYIDTLNIKHVSMGDGAKTFNYALSYALDNFKNDDIVYFLENDYLHRLGSYQALVEGFTLNPSFLTLYDHPDKYMDPSIGGNSHCKGGAEDTRVYLTDNNHWKITNSTTMTFASKINTLRQVESILRKYTSSHHPHDYEMFMELRNENYLLISPIPGYSTHGETQWLAPIIEWDKI